MKNKLIIIFLFILVSCSPEQRLSRLLRKHPELKRWDTLTINDTSYIKGNRIDSNFLFTGDTVRIYNNRQEIKYFYDTKTNTNYIEGKIKDTTIYKTIRVPVEKIIYPTFWNQYKELIILCNLILIFIVLMLLLSKRIKPKEALG